jgi:hypothetical protein
MKKLLLLSFTFLSMNVMAQSPKDRQNILKILDSQTQAWNNGDLINFMNGYWQSDSLMYIGKNGVRYGYNNTLKSYQKGYPDKASMGTLKFEVIKLDFTASYACFVVGKWQLTRPEKGDLSGHYTLIWRKIKGNWVIIADHSS